MPTPREVEWQKALDRVTPQQTPQVRALIRDAARATEVFGEDELEDYAQKLRRAGAI